MMLKDNNFISAVVYLHNDGARAMEFCRTVAAELDANFKQYELVVVDDACTDDTVKQLRAWGREQDAPLTILHMSIYHGLEDAMNAGLDAAIGDYVYEFDSTELCYAPTLIMQAYRAALDGNEDDARSAARTGARGRRTRFCRCSTPTPRAPTVCAPMRSVW